MTLSLRDVAPESVLLAGAGRAILLQLARPDVGYGVARHSNFAADPLKRLHATLSYIYALSNGTPKQRRMVQSHVQRAHLPVTFAGDENVPAYDASAAQAQLWIAATLYDSAARVYDAVFPAMSEADAESVYQSYAVLGTALGMPATLWPRTRADFVNYWDAQLKLLSVGPEVYKVAEDLLAARSAPWYLKLAMPLARFLTVGLLPAGTRPLFGFTWTTGQERRLQLVWKVLAAAVKVIPARVRHAPMRYYLRRMK